MKRVVIVSFFLVGAFVSLSGCAVIDFLDGKDFTTTRDDIPRQQYGSGNSGGGHSGSCH